MHETGFPSKKIFNTYLIDGRVFFRIFNFYMVFDDLFLNLFSTCVSDDRKYVGGGTLYACINYTKIKGIDSGEITSLPNSQK